MKSLTVLLTPEGETLWIRRPEILLLTDQVLLDRDDYQRILSRAGRSDLDSKIAALLKAYVEEGYVQLVDYKSLLLAPDRSAVFEASRGLIEGMSFSEKRQAAEYGHAQFANYLGAKLEHLNPGEPLFRSLASARLRTHEFLRKIKRLDESRDAWPSDVAEMQRRAISKWLAAEVLAKRLGSDFVFDLDEYRPYAKLIRERVLVDDQPSRGDELFPSDVEPPLRVLWTVVKTQLPGIALDGPDDILRFRPTRDEFGAFRRVLHDLIQYHAEVKDETILLRYATRRLKDAQDEVQALFNRVPRRLLRCLPSCLAYLLNKVWVPIQAQPVADKVRKSQSKDLFKRVEDAYQKLCCFSMYAARKPLPALTKNIKRETQDGGHWITGAPLSWYEMGENLQKQVQATRNPRA